MKLDLAAYRDKKICIALSGGGDSVALLHYFYRNAAKYGICLSAVNCEHGIRGENSLKDTAFVKNLCEKWNIPLYTYAALCLSLAKENKVSVETAARNFRYACFEELLQSSKVDFIATAHHQGDNAETVLFNLCRGASLTGMGGICERKGYIRPLLSTPKSEIEKYLTENGLKYCHDETNDDTTITRNALRLKILPALEQIIPNAAAGITRFSALAREDDALLYELALPLVTFAGGVFKITFSDKKPIFYRAALSALKRMGVEKDYTLVHLNALYALQTANNGERVSLPQDIVGVREYDGVALYRPESKADEELPFGLGSFDLGGVSFSVIPREKMLKQGHGYINLYKIPSSAVFRTREEGDIFTKFGGGTKKLKDYLIDKKIPRRTRDKLIVLADGKDVLAIVGLEISDKVKVEENCAVAQIIIQKKGE